jgi:hypothetical protein
MSDSAGNLPKPNPGPNGEGGGLAPEDADRFASAFVPSWQFDEAPFAAGAMNAADLQELGAPSSNVASDRTLVDRAPPGPGNALAAKPPETGEEMTAADVDVSGLVAQMNSAGSTQPSAAQPQPFASRQATVFGLAQPPPPQAPGPFAPQPAPPMPLAATLAAPAPPPAAPAPFVVPPPAPLQQAPVQYAQPLFQPPAGSPGSNAFVSRPAFQRVGPDDSVGLPVRKSNTGLMVGGLVALAAVAVFAGIHFMKSEPPASEQHVEAVAAKPAATENHIPPPPAETETTAAAPPPPAETAMPAAALPKPALATQSPAPAPPQRQAIPAHQPSRDVSEPVHSHPAAPPKSPTRSGSGGIVRDNPF